MPIELTDLNSLDSDTIDQNLSLLRSYLADNYPSMDLQPGGVLYSLLLRPAALFHTLNQTNMERLRQSNSMLAIASDPTLADDDIVNAVISNYSLVRDTGGSASGTVNMIFSTNDFVAIPSSALFSANGMLFRPVTAVFGVASNPTTTANVVFSKQLDGTYVLPVSVVATTTGAAGNLGKSTVLTPENINLSNLITVVAASDFDGGKDAETNAALVTRLANGITTPSLASRSSIKALIQNNFASVTDVSVIGAGDSEMLRDGHSTLGIKTLGKADVYVRTRTKPLTVKVTKAATVADVSTKTFNMTFTRDEYPGLYHVESINYQGSTALGTLPFNYVTRGTDTSAIAAVDFVPSMVGTESVFTRYQTVEVQFVAGSADTRNLSNGDTVNFDVTLIYMPDIDKISDWLLDRSRRHPGGDYLVKAPIPCFVGVGLRIIVGVGDQSPDTEAIKAAVIDAVNNVTFAEGQLDASVIINAAQSLLPRKSKVAMPIDLRGRVIKPDGKEYWTFGPDALTIPVIPDEMVSPRTVSFFLDSSSIIVEAVPSNALPV